MHAHDARAGSAGEEGARPARRRVRRRVARASRRRAQPGSFSSVPSCSSSGRRWTCSRTSARAPSCRRRPPRTRPPYTAASGPAAARRPRAPDRPSPRGRGARAHTPSPRPGRASRGTGCPRPCASVRLGCRRHASTHTDEVSCARGTGGRGRRRPHLYLDNTRRTRVFHHRVLQTCPTRTPAMVRASHRASGVRSSKAAAIRCWLTHRPALSCRCSSPSPRAHIHGSKQTPGPH